MKASELVVSLSVSEGLTVIARVTVMAAEVCVPVALTMVAGRPPP